MELLASIAETQNLAPDIFNVKNCTLIYPKQDRNHWELMLSAVLNT